MKGRESDATKLARKHSEACARVVADAVMGALGCRRDAFGVDVTSTHTCNVAFHYSVTITYDELASLSMLLGTTSIDLAYTSGWGGTEATPGDTTT